MNEGERMLGYNPNCDNYFKCLTCKGEGNLLEAESGSGNVWKEQVTCNGVRGKNQVRVRTNTFEL
jgi:hypothetical protein